MRKWEMWGMKKWEMVIEVKHTLRYSAICQGINCLNCNNSMPVVWVNV